MPLNLPQPSPNIPNIPNILIVMLILLLSLISCSKKCSSNHCSQCALNSNGSLRCVSCMPGAVSKGETANYLCYTCDIPNCNSCRWPNQCTYCKREYQLLNNRCVHECQPLCQSCTTEINCVSCKENAEISGGKCRCKRGYYQKSNSKGGECQPYDCSAIPYCNSCTQTQCISCIDEYAISRQACQPICESLCQSCSIPTNCVQCKANSDLSSGICSCQLTHFEKNAECRPFDCSSMPNCVSCTAAKCQNCESKYSLSSRSYCHPICDSLCQSCSTPTNCVWCKANTSLRRGLCSCQITHFEQNEECKAYDCSSMPNCVSCTATKCLSCQNRYLLSASKCRPICQSLCQSCSTPTNCLHCKGNAQLKNGQCSCQPAFFESNAECQAFDCSSMPNCTSCTATYCLSCISEYYLSSNYECQPICADICEHCSTPQNCLNCKANTYLSSGHCSCQPAFYENNTECQPYDCSIMPHCASCTATTCLQCVDSHYSLNPNSNSSSNSECKYRSELTGFYSIAESWLKGINSFPQSRIYLKVCASLFVLFDDYWYYSYHERNYTNIQLTEEFLKFEMQVNEERLMPDFLNISEITAPIEPHFEGSKNFIPFTHPSVAKFQNSESYFLKSTKQLYIDSYLLSLGILILCKLIITVLRVSGINKLNKLKSKEDFFLRTMYDYFRQKSNQTAFFQIFIEQHLIFIAFESGVQMRSFFAFRTTDKINLILCLLFMLAALLLSSAFYILSSKPSLKNQFQLTKAFSKGDITPIDCVLSGIRCGMIGFIHSYFLSNYELQMEILLFMKICICIALILLRPYFHRRLKMTVFLCTLSYFSFGCMIDSFFLYISRFESISPFASFTERVELCLTSGLLLSSVIRMMGDITCEIRLYVKSLQMIDLQAQALQEVKINEEAMIKENTSEKQNWKSKIKKTTKQGKFVHSIKFWFSSGSQRPQCTDNNSDIEVINLY